eukprot:EG_transcript_7793
MCRRALELFGTLFGCAPDPTSIVEAEEDVAKAGALQKSFVPRLMFVSLDLEDLDTFLDALHPNVHPLVYHPATTTCAELAALVREHCAKLQPATVAWACHGPMFGDTGHGDFHTWVWQLVKDSNVTFDGEHLNSYPKIDRNHFLDALRDTLPNGREVHLLGAEFLATTEGRVLVHALEKHTGLRWAACHGITEENWTLDCDGKTVDVSVLYFQPDKLQKWRGTMASVKSEVILDESVLWEELSNPPSPVDAPKVTEAGFARLTAADARPLRA